MTFNKSNVIVSGSRSSLSEYANYTTVYPKPVMVEGKIVLTQEIVSKPNVKYVIKWNFDLNGTTVTIPEGCLLEFDGGAISNGTLVGQSTILIYNQPLNDILTATLEGTWRHESGVKADEEDITDLNGELKFKDKDYNAEAYSGLGRKHLRKNIVNGVNTLTQSMINKSNTIYVIQYDFTLGEDITVPANCVLEFDGGSLSNGILTGSNTSINALPRVTIFDNIDIQGSWNVPDIYVEWINIPNTSECREQLWSILRLQNDNVYQNIYLPNNEIAFTPVNNIEDIPSYYAKGLVLIVLSSNTHLHIVNTIRVNANNMEGYRVVSITSKKNIIIDGGGTIIGDVGNHTYIEGSTSEHGMGLYAYSCSDVDIEFLTVEKCIGDGIYIGHGNKNFSVDNVQCVYNRRQGMSVIDIDFISIKNSAFSYTGYIEGTAPQSGIDFEPNNNNEHIRNVIIDNCVFEYNTNHDLLFYCENGNKNITLSNCNIQCTIPQNNGYNLSYKNIRLRGSFDNMEFNNCLLGQIVIDAESEDFGRHTININNCNIFGFIHSTLHRDKYSSQNFVLRDCILNPNKIMSSENSLMYMQCMTNIDFYNCVIDWSGDNVRSDGVTKISSSTQYLRGKLEECNITSFTFRGYDFYNCTMNDCRIYPKRGKKNYAIGNILNTNQVYYIWICSVDSIGDESELPETDTKIYIMNNTYVPNSSVTMIYRGMDNTVPVDVTVIEHVDQELMDTDQMNVRSKTINNSVKYIKNFGNKLIRPLNAPIGFCYFDTNLGKPIYWNGTAWVDATGTPV